MSDKDKNSLLELCTSDSKVLSILGGIGRKDSQNINEKDHEKILDILTESLSSNGFYFCGHTEIVSE